MDKNNITKGFIKEDLLNLKILRPFNLKGTFEDVENYIKMCEEQREQALELVRTWDKDEEIQKLKDQIKQMKEESKHSMSFVITQEENEEIHKWMDAHVKEKHNGSYYAGAIGGMFTYKFIPTSIGEIGEVICSCGETFCFREL